MMEIDDMIRKALCEEDMRWFDQLDEQSLSEMVADSLRGRRRWAVILVYALLAFFFVGAVFTLIQIYRSTNTREIVLYGIGFFFSSLAIALLKTWYWMELYRNSMIRELKRIELQLARLSSRVGVNR